MNSEVLSGLEGDFRFQYSYVADQAYRLGSLQDTNSASPSLGCFHYSYWRDKTSEFPDTRFQEGGATLGLLSLSELYHSGIALSAETLRAHFLFSLKAWSRQQHRDGSFDEWYKYEHGFAVTTFSLIALGLTVHFLGDRLTEEEFALFSQTATKAATWLLTHDDMVKTNHQMAGAAALAIAHKLLGSAEFLEGARRKHQIAIDSQTQEGWFNEIAGADLGYCFVLLDYAMLYREFTGDSSGLDAMKKLFKFIFPLVQSDLTISPEGGLCLNPYVSRLGTLLLAQDLPEAAALTRAFHEESVGMKGIGPYLADDLRLCRWSHLPLVTALFLKEKLDAGWKLIEQPSLRELQPSGLIVREQSKIIAFNQGEFSVNFMPCGGGGLRIVKRSGRSYQYFEDLGFVYHAGERPLCSVGYDRSREIKRSDSNSVSMVAPLSPATFFFPGFLTRTTLRVLGAVPGLPIWLRRGIDLYRKIFKTAVNQSSAPVSSAKTEITLERKVSFTPTEVQIEDRLSSRAGTTLDLSRLECLLLLDHIPCKPELEKKRVQTLVIRKHVGLSGRIQLSFLTHGDQKAPAIE